MNKKILNLFITLPLLLLWGCEFESDKIHFTDIPKPGDTTEMFVNLNNVEPGGTIMIYQTTCLRFTIDTQGKPIIDNVVIFSYGDRKELAYVDQQGRGEICINGYDVQGADEMNLTITTRSGSGSLADLMGFEQYTGELTYKLKAIPNLVDLIKINHRRTDDGFVEIYWNDLNIEGLVVKEYNVSYYTYNETVSFSTQNNSFVDETYYINDRNYYLEVIFSSPKDQYISTYYNVNHYFELNYLTPVRNNNTYTVTWEKPPYNCQYMVEWSDYNGTHTSELLPYETTSYSMETGLLDNSMSGVIFFLPMNYDNEYLYTFPRQPFNYSSDNTFGYLDNFVYNQTTDIIYGYNGSSLKAISLKDKMILSTRNGDEYFNLIATSPVSEKVAVANNSRIFVFPGKDLLDPMVIQKSDGETNKQLLNFTTSDYLQVIEYGYKYSGNYTHYINVHTFNTTTGNEEYMASMELPVESMFVTVTEDGKYLAAGSRNGIAIFSLSASEATLVHSDNGYYLGARAIPGQPGNILLKEGDIFVTRNLADFSIIQKSPAFPNARLFNIDPVSGLFMFQSADNKLRFYNFDTMTEVYSTDYQYTYTDFGFFNSVLITRYGNYYDLTNLINK